jgi:putative phage-type endonuclease
MADALATTKNGESEKRRRLKLEIVAERLSGRAREVYVNDAMKHGIRYEPEARQKYEDVTGNLVELCGLAMHDTIPHLGASPDGLVGDDGCIEIKCPSLTTFLQYKLDGCVVEQYKPQMLLQLAVCQRKWCDFVAYHPYLPESMNMFIVRFEPSAEELQGVLEAAEKFNAEVEEIISKLSGKGEF